MAVDIFKLRLLIQFELVACLPLECAKVCKLTHPCMVLSSYTFHLTNQIKNILPDTAAGGSFPGSKCPGRTSGKFFVESVKILASLMYDRNNAMYVCNANGGNEACPWNKHMMGQSSQINSLSDS